MPKHTPESSQNQPQFIKISNRATNITNQRFYRLVALGPMSRTKYGEILWLCQCDCGEKVIVSRTNLRTKHTKSCGCFHLENSKNVNKTHGMSKTPVYTCWSSMISRCTNPKNYEYHRYGGNHIEICAEWRNSFEKFFAYVSNLPHYGETGRTLDRIVNENGNYEPGNVRWATYTQQSRNRRDNHLLTYKGETKSVAEWSEILNLSRSALLNRLHLGWSIEKTFTQEVKQPRKSKPITYKNKTQSISSWSRELGISLSAIHHRLQRNWTLQEIFETPVGQRRKKKYP